MLRRTPYNPRSLRGSESRFARSPLPVSRESRRTCFDLPDRDAASHGQLSARRALRVRARCCSRGCRALDERAAVRHPHRDRFPMSPARQLAFAFEEAPRWDAPALETALAREAGTPLRLVLTDNRSVLLSFRREAGCLLLRLHRMFLHAPARWWRSLARNIRRKGRAADGEVRRFMNENLHRVRKSAAGDAAPRHARPRLRPHLGLRGPQRPLLRRPPAGADHLGPRRAAARGAAASPSAATTRCSPSSASTPCSTAATCRSTSWRASSTTRCCTTTWAGCPTARGAPSTTRGPSARRRRASRGTARPSPGRRRTSPSCSGRATRSTARAARRARPRARAAR